LSGQVRYALGERLVDRYLEFVAGREMRHIGLSGRSTGTTCWARAVHPVTHCGFGSAGPGYAG
jgi:hypothetical protein